MQCFFFTIKIITKQRKKLQHVHLFRSDVSCLVRSEAYLSCLIRSEAYLSCLIRSEAYLSCLIRSEAWDTSAHLLVDRNVTHKVVRKPCQLYIRCLGLDSRLNNLPSLYACSVHQIKKNSSCTSFYDICFASHAMLVL